MPHKDRYRLDSRNGVYVQWIRLVLERPRHKRLRECTDLGVFVFAAVMQLCNVHIPGLESMEEASSSFQLRGSQSQIGLHELLCILKSDGARECESGVTDVLPEHIVFV